GEIDDALLSRLGSGIEAAYAVDKGRRVRHRHDGGHPSARRRARDRAKILLVGLPGIARMHVGIDEAGNDLPLRRVDYLRATYRPIRLDRDDLLVLDDDVGRSRTGWCDDAAAAHDLGALCTGR